MLTSSRSVCLTLVPFFVTLQVAVAVAVARAQEAAQNPTSSQSARTSQGQQAATQQEASSEGNTQLSTKQVANLPLNGRDFTKLLALAGGTTTDTNGANNFTLQFAINGQRGVNAVFAMDGFYSTDSELGGATFSNFNVNAIQEIESQSGVMPPEIGEGAAGFTNVITESGSDRIHGDVFEFLRNSALDAAISSTAAASRGRAAFRPSSAMNSDSTWVDP